MSTKLQKIHEARTARAKGNIKEMFYTGSKFGVMYTEQEKQMMQDLNPGTYEIYRECHES